MEKQMGAAEEIMVARVKKRWKENTEISNETTKLARQFNPNTYRMKVRG
jgi:hypothetical protein